MLRWRNKRLEKSETKQNIVVFFIPLSVKCRPEIISLIYFLFRIFILFYLQKFSIDEICCQGQQQVEIGDTQSEEENFSIIMMLLFLEVLKYGNGLLRWEEGEVTGQLATERILLDIICPIICIILPKNSRLPRPSLSPSSSLTHALTLVFLLHLVKEKMEKNSIQKQTKITMGMGRLSVCV